MRIYSTVERTFKKRLDGLYQEYLDHFVVFEDPRGNKTTKLDKREIGRVYKEDTTNRSFHGEASYTFADDGVTRRLIALSNYQQG